VLTAEIKKEITCSRTYLKGKQFEIGFLQHNFHTYSIMGGEEQDFADLILQICSYE
jgi:hypothetical protein